MREIKDKTGHYLEVNVSDYELISNPLLNKGMSFSEEERIAFNLEGIIPPHSATIDEQRQRSYEALQSKTSDLEKYLYLRDLQDSNEVLYYNLLCNHLSETLPIVYTPTVGLGCQRLSHIYRRPRGLYLAYPYRSRIEKILANPRFDEVEVIVVSDGERILGLGDQGAGGMGIPIGKLALYSACAGIPPAATLPILLDTGTDNPDLIKDPLYIGWQNPRIRGKEYDDFIETFVQAVKKRFPHVLLQWEDFAQINANPLLQRYRDQLCTFNDDIQGTAAITVGTLLSAVHATKGHIRDQRITIVGAGSAGCGIANMIMQAMIEDGLTPEEARSRFYLVDRNGLLLEGMKDLLSFQQPFIQPRNAITNWKLANANMVSLKDVVQNFQPTVLIGVSGQPNIFTEEIIREMASHVTRPIVFPLSNPTVRCEAKPQDVLRWTNDQALIGTGSPFGQVTKKGKPFTIDQTNNCYIFPGMGLGLIAVKSSVVTERMFMAAAIALAACAPIHADADANLLPPIDTIRDVSLRVAVAVAKEAINAGLAKEKPANLEEFLRQKMWEPQYLPYKRKK